MNEWMNVGSFDDICKWKKHDVNKQSVFGILESLFEWNGYHWRRQARESGNQIKNKLSRNNSYNTQRFKTKIV